MKKFSKYLILVFLFYFQIVCSAYDDFDSSSVGLLSKQDKTGINVLDVDPLKKEKLQKEIKRLYEKNKEIRSRLEKDLSDKLSNTNKLLSDLYDAIIFNDSKFLDFLYRTYPDVREVITKFKFGFNPLIFAIECKNIEISRQLLAYGAPPNIIKHTDLPLCCAIRYADMDMAKLLLEYGADPNLQSPYGYYPLTLCINKLDDLHVNMIVTLLTYGANPNLYNNAGETSLMHAVSKQNPLAMDVLLKHTKAANPHNNTNPYLYDDEGRTALMLALVDRRYSLSMKASTLDFFLANNFDINVPNNLGITYLMIAAYYNLPSIAIKLVEVGANVDMIDLEGNNALMYALLVKNQDTAKMLISKDCNVLTKNYKDMSPWFFINLFFDNTFLSIYHLVNVFDDSVDTSLENLKQKIATDRRFYESLIGAIKSRPQWKELVLSDTDTLNIQKIIQKYWTNLSSKMNEPRNASKIKKYLRIIQDIKAKMSVDRVATPDSDVIDLNRVKQEIEQKEEDHRNLLNIQSSKFFEKFEYRHRKKLEELNSLAPAKAVDVLSDHQARQVKTTMLDVVYEQEGLLPDQFMTHRQAITKQLESLIERSGLDVAFIGAYNFRKTLYGYVDVSVDVAHIFNTYVSWRYNETRKLYEPMFDGGHNIAAVDRLIKSNLVEKVSVRTISGGCQKFILYNTITKKNFAKTVFPDDFTNAEIMNAILNAQVIKENDLMNTKELFVKFKDEKKPKNEFYIKIVMKQKWDSQYEIVTAYPIEINE